MDLCLSAKYSSEFFSFWILKKTKKRNKFKKIKRAFAPLNKMKRRANMTSFTESIYSDQAQLIGKDMREFLLRLHKRTSFNVNQ